MRWIWMLVFLVASTAQAGDTGNDLIEQCYPVEALESDSGLSTIQRQHLAYCLGLLRGLVTGAQIQSIQGTQKLFCVPQSATNSQLAKVALKYLKENPQHLHLASPALAIAAFENAFPCR